MSAKAMGRTLNLLIALFVATVWVKQTEALGGNLLISDVNASVPVVQVQETQAIGTFRGVGVVTAVNPSAGAVTLNHQEIKGFMAAMIMMYRVKPFSLAAGLKPGDKVEFIIDAQSYTIRDIKRIEPAR